MVKRRTASWLTALVLTVSLAGNSLWAEGAVAASAPQTQAAQEQTAALKARTISGAIADWESWATDHVYRLDHIQPAASTDSGDFQDLQMLKPLLYDKRIVFLGESSHGVAEFNLVKTRLIQFLHQEMGYRVVAFESGLYNTAKAYGNVGTQTAEQSMKDAIFGVWWTKQTLPLFEYIKNTQQTKQPLALTGFDMQLQPPLMDGAWLTDKKLAQQLKQAEQSLSDYSSAVDPKPYKKEKSKLIQVYKDALKSTQTKASQASIKKLYPDNPKMYAHLVRALSDRIKLAEEYVEISIQTNIGMQKGDYTWFFKSMEWRDQAMLDNLMWLANEVYPNEKIIVWAHNDHIRKAQSEVMGSPYPIKMMGELLSDEIKKYSYVLGLYPANGQTADNMGNVHDVLPLEPGSIESILSAGGSPYTFIDLRYRMNERGNSWMFEPRYSYSWGMIPESLVARDQYDGILLIDDVSPPEYMRGNK